VARTAFSNGGGSSIATDLSSVASNAI